ncbi:hypothetical protein ACQKCH_17870 [Nubsella zeaxanthinifaciens]|uniref:hypothetical protein n=1 Tax=Nubsella zeaxanthinifaciens TaxID=392412 RepID=UPI003D046506
MKRLLLTFLVASCLLASSALFAQKDQSPAGGPPKLTELIGFWKKVNLPQEPNINKVNPWPQKFQWFAFYDNGKVYSMMKDSDENYTAKDLQTLFDILPPEQTPNFKLEGQFLTIDNKHKKDYEETWGVNLFAIDINDYLKKGNLMMTLDDGNGNAVYYRLLKRID